VLDNWSTDGTFEDLALLASARSGLSIQRFPAQEEPRYFEWKSILSVKEEIAARHPGRWIIHHDCDELRCSPWADISFREGLHIGEQMGFNAIDFTVCEFRPTSEQFSRGMNPEEQIPYFEFGRRTDHFIQIKAWRQGARRVDLASTGGRQVRVGGYFHTALF